MEVALFLDASRDLISLPRRSHQVSGKAQGKVQGYDSEVWIWMKSPVVTSQQTLQFGLYAWPDVHNSAFSPAIALTLVLAPERKTAAQGTLD